MRFIPIIFVILMMIPFSYAGLEVLSVDEVVFFSADDDFGGESFQILAIDNGGSEKIFFSDLEPGVSYDIRDTSGYITATTNNVRAEYPYSARTQFGAIYNMVRLNGGASKFFWGDGSASDWCRDLAQKRQETLFAVAKPSGSALSTPGQFYCYITEKHGTVADIGQYQYKWTENFKIWNPLENEFQELILDSQNREGLYERSSDNNILVKYSFSGLNVNSAIPDLDSYSIYQVKLGEYIISEFDSSETDDYSKFVVFDRFLREYLGKHYQLIAVEGKSCTICLVAQDPVAVEDEINNDIDSFTTERTINRQGWTARLSDGKVILDKDDEDYPIAPVFTIKLDAEWIGVYQPQGKPVLESFKVDEDEYIEGDQNAKFISRVRNDGESSSFSYSLSCSPSDVNIDTVSSQNFDAGETKNLEHDIQSGVTGDSVISSCCLIVRDRNFPSIVSDKKCDTVKFIERNQCPTGLTEGSQTCSLDGGINTCKKTEDGILVLQPSPIVCPNGCSLEGLQATCSPVPGCEDEYESGRSANDGICEIFEEIGKQCQSYEDCTTIGDGYCSKRERDLGIAPQDCATPPKPVLGGSTLIFVLLGVFAVLMIGGAFFLKLRKEGFFNN